MFLLPLLKYMIDLLFHGGKYAIGMKQFGNKKNQLLGNTFTMWIRRELCFYENRWNIFLEYFPNTEGDNNYYYKSENGIIVIVVRGSQ